MINRITVRVGIFGGEVLAEEEARSILLPLDPQAWKQHMKQGIEDSSGNMAVVITTETDSPDEALITFGPGYVMIDPWDQCDSGKLFGFIAKLKELKDLRAGLDAVIHELERAD